MDHYGGTPLTPLADGLVPTLLQGLILGIVLFLNPLLVLYVVVAQLVVQELPHGCTVGWSTQS